MNLTHEAMLLLRILLAAGLSAVIGIEREFHGRPAGLRTHLLVGTGACLAIVAFQAIWTASADPGSVLLSEATARIAAGVITGIGFLGAGTIIKVGDWVRGLTTAASLWFVASLGVAAGLGAFVIAAGGGIVGLGILAFIDPLASRIPSRIYQTLTLTVEAGRQRDVKAAIQVCCKRGRRTRATLVGWAWSSQQEHVMLTYRIRQNDAADLEALAEEASSIDGVIGTKVEL